MAINYIAEVLDSRGQNEPPQVGSVVSGIYEPKRTPGIRVFHTPMGDSYTETSSGSGIFKNIYIWNFDSPKLWTYIIDPCRTCRRLV